ncbi:MAG TPA: DUF188 domain-containing protein [Syntrophomonadaceae bacterium]|nr:YaiI/YqxD family protein [Syntrophomonadaceae bacterium]HOQ08837.1 DUF188 domain-containing protein [Syntrophomonadaceae bacterium]HPU47648.1 DUF188 domain-containing protein [Syntrophomonadaceae bacterium]
MRILVDADACPVMNIIQSIASTFGIQVIWVASIDHNIHSQYGKVITVDHAPEAVDLYIVNHTVPGDIVVTQDLGLASLVLAKGAQPLTPLGRILHEEDMDNILYQRYINKKARRQGYHIGKTTARTDQDDQRFKQALLGLITAAMGRTNSGR